MAPWYTPRRPPVSGRAPARAGQPSSAHWLIGALGRTTTSACLGTSARTGRAVQALRTILLAPWDALRRPPVSGLSALSNWRPGTHPNVRLSRGV
ncbi:hypothetical protein PF002_g31385 [Phytophthora fragariae]|uniref:Uncharacterized protein n=1 Tax=Phytophthora fragariae TaxID=53985 RepID=A0A6A3DJM5_9STRA|nr:hypothetical protein PF003_g28784 [Phytophthora fragariae]KAE8918348.1 hypothetical protein PF009_g31336 [Phytophthora fragariae]KAE9165318.1 hypothetical protein PF002_g31385 [Phytophthora fragariae]